MTRSLSLACALAMLGTSAYASSTVELGQNKDSGTIVTIGKAPDKEKKILNLGALRTGEASLPRGPRTRAERMKMRASRALDRQKAVTGASRSKNKRREQAIASADNLPEGGLSPTPSRVME